MPLDEALCVVERLDDECETGVETRDRLGDDAEVSERRAFTAAIASAAAVGVFAFFVGVAVGGGGVFCDVGVFCSVGIFDCAAKTDGGGGVDVALGGAFGGGAGEIGLGVFCALFGVVGARFCAGDIELLCDPLRRGVSAFLLRFGVADFVFLSALPLHDIVLDAYTEISSISNYKHAKIQQPL